MMPAPPPPLPTKGKARAQAAPAPSKAKPAKKECPTKKALIPSKGLPLHLTQTFPQEGKPDHHLVTIAIPDATVAHVIRQGSKGLKQLHDISGAQVLAYMLKSGLHDECHISIRGTNEQIGDALVVLGKCLVWKHVHGPTTKKTVPGFSADWVDPVPPRVASKPQARPSAPPSGLQPSSRVPALGPMWLPLGPLLKSGTPQQLPQPSALDPLRLPHPSMESSCIHQLLCNHIPLPLCLALSLWEKHPPHPVMSPSSS